MKKRYKDINFYINLKSKKNFGPDLNNQTQTRSIQQNKVKQKSKLL